MVWIKRNLLFALSAAVGLILMLGAGYFLYAGLSDSSAAASELTAAQNELSGLTEKTPYPSKENIQLAKDAQEQVRKVLNQFHVTFAPIPTPPNMNEQQFKDFLDKTILQLQTQATNHGVNLTPGYEFGFSGLSSKLNFPTNDLRTWAMQLQQIKAICNVIYQGKANSLESIRRTPAPSETNSIAVAANEFLNAASVTNEAAVCTPYEVVFRAYSSEIAAVINGFLRSTNNFIIKNIDVAPTTTLAVTQTPVAGANYGTPYARTSVGVQPRLVSPAQGPGAVRGTVASDGPQGPEIIAQENLSRVVMVVEVVNPKAP